jgi:hypothetical protein
VPAEGLAQPQARLQQVNAKEGRKAKRKEKRKRERERKGKKKEGKVWTSSLIINYYPMRAFLA